VLSALLAQHPDNVVAMDNLAPLLLTLGRPDEATAWTARRLALEPEPPFHHLRQGQEAVARGAFDEALAQFSRERRITGASHELAFWEARAWFGRGDAERAQQALREAMALAGSPGQQTLYAGKMAWLREHARP
jgi:predicted Zn-dependent protease